MERSRYTTLSIAYVVVVATVVGAPLAFGPGTVAADNHTSSAPYSIVQGGQCTPLWPIGDGSTSSTEYYDYRNRIEDGSGDYSSYGTTDLQESNVSQLYVYRGSDGDSLVVIHDVLDDADRGGGAVSFNVTGLPIDGSWTVRDDDYDGMDDRYTIGETTSELHWMWDSGRTDGGVYRGLGESGWSRITIDPAFADESWAATSRPNSPWPHASEGPTEWIVRDGAGNTRQLDMSAPVSITQGTCGGAAPDADLSATSPVTAGSSVTLDASNSTDPDGDVFEYRWDADGDGSVDSTTTDATYAHEYETEGSYEPSVTVVDENGNAASASATVEVQAPDSPPSAAFSIDDSSPTVGQEITLDASESSDDSGIADYSWTFGDGNESTGQTTTHAYAEAGNYTVSLTVTDDGGNTDTTTETVLVEETASPLSADVSVNDSSPTVDQVVEFDGSGSTGEIASYAWDFGDGGSASGAIATHVYEEGGTVEVTLTVADGEGETDTDNVTLEVTDPATPTASLDAPENVSVNETFELDATGSSDDGEIVEYRWDVDGDGTVDRSNTTGTITHAYDVPGDHAVTVTVVDNDSNVASTSAVVHVDDETPPTAALSAPPNATAGTEVAFDATNSTDDVGIVEYEWDVDGDGTVDRSNTTGTITHAYEEPGTYAPTVTVFDADGNTGTASTTISVEAAGDGTSSIAEFTINDTSPAVDQPIGLSATGSTDDPANATYEWDFGDGANTTGRNVTHAYDDPGEYTVSLTVTVDENSTTASQSITVADPNDDGGNSGSGGGGGPPGGGGAPPGGGGGAPSGGGGGSGGGGAAPSSDDGRAQIEVRNASVDRDTVFASEPVAVTVEVENVGDADGAETIGLSVDGRTVDDRVVRLGEGETAQVELSTRLDAVGERTLRVGDWSTTVTVEPGEADISVVDVRVENGTVQAGQHTSVVATVENSGGVAGQHTVRLRVFDEVVDRKTVEVPPGERRTVRFLQRFDSPGTYEIDVSGRQVSAEVVGDSSSSAAFVTEVPNGADRIISLGYIGVGGIALAAAAIFATRRL